MAAETQSSPSSLVKSLARGTALYSIAMFAQRIAGLILLPFNTHFLDPSDYGTLDLLEQIGVVVGVLIGLNLSSALGYFYFKEESDLYRNKVAGTIMVGAALIGALAGISGIMFSGQISKLVFGRSDYQGYLIFVFVSLPLSALLESFFTWLRVTERPGMYAWMSILRLGITIVMTITLLAVFRLRVIGVLTSSFIAMLGTALILGTYCFRKVRLTFDRGIFAAAFWFAFPIGLSAIAIFIINVGDRFFLRYYQNLADVGVYGVAYKIGMLMSLLQSSFFTYWNSQVYAVVRRDDADYVTARIFTYVMLALSFALVALVVVCRPVIAIMVTRPGFENAAYIAPVIALAYYTRAIGDFYRCFLIAAGHPAYDAACNWIGAVICLGGYFILIPRYGMWGAAYATLLTFAALAIISAVWAWKVRPFRIEGTRLFTLAAVSTGLLVIYYVAPVQSVPLQIAWAFVLIAAFPAILWISGFAEPAEIGKLKSILTTARNRASRRCPSLRL
jgi:O-antigen/teichoic acid export membrane protein